ncbi:MAG TPA: peptidoglycan DD-metalloendopeptidase family protein [Steroidobacteraceae bacterium]|nr:peptidoglycan DD-metalloendopeptidase family protein [Steroidobacteraceae bacterium]
MRRKIFGATNPAHTNLARRFRPVRRFRAVMARVGPYAAAASAALVLWHAAHDRPEAPLSLPAPLVYPDSRPNTGGTADGMAPAAAVAVSDKSDNTSGAPLMTQQAGVASTTWVIVGRNDTMDAIFRRMALDKSDLAAIRNLPGIRQSIDFLKPGDAIRLTHGEDGAIKELSRKVSETQTLKVVREEDGFAARLISNPVQTRIRTAAATIDSSLFQAAEAAAISDMVALKLANVFAWDIDFVLDIRSGDRFTAVYEQIYQDGKYLRDGELLAAEFVNDGKVYRAVRYTAGDGTAGYYTPEGRPLRKAFLRAPVDFTRVSSGFNPARLHPILNTIRGHMGTDYAAPTGTPVHAAGDGRISFAGVRGGYGNAIVLAHSNSVSTLYGHMSRFAKNIKIGSHVRQGEVIGYVGMTGLATGPHLHYEYLMNGVHKDPQTVRLPGAEPLRAGSLQRFREAAAPLLAGLDTPTAAPTAPVAIARTIAARTNQH